MPQKKNKRKPKKTTQPVQKVESKRMSGTQIAIIVVSSIIILSMLLSAIRF